MVSAGIDWLSYTIPWNAKRIRRLDPSVGFEMIIERASGVTERWVEERALHGYRWQFSSIEKPGLKVMLSPTTSEMGIHVQYAGSALAGEDVLERLRYALDFGGRITRLDLAVDVQDAWDIRALYELALAGGATTRAKQFSMMESATGKTFYAGSRTSQKFLRIYDKGGQTGTNRPWTRVELECKGEFASNIAKYIDQNGTTGIPAIIRGFLDFETVPVWCEVMNSNMEKISAPRIEKGRDTRRWLLETVAPALAKFQLQTPAFIEEFECRLAMLRGDHFPDVP